MTDEVVQTLAEAVGLAIAAEHRPGVAENLERLLVQARLVMSVDLPVEMEPAPTFRP